MDGHVLQHTLGVSLEAFSKRFRSVFVSVVGDEGDVGSFHGLGEFTGLANILADILVVSHQNFDTGGISLGLHGLELDNGGSTGLFQVNALGSVSDRFAQQAWVVSGTSGNQSQSGGIWGWKIIQGGSKCRSVFGFGVRLPFPEFLSGIRIGTGSHEPWLDDVVQRGAGAFFLEHLNGVVPSHSSVRGSASDKDNLGLAFLR
mmetsp:Transcript_26941/g.59392  ORF Transcript_26941/g.59392 Transcript_26941/m.59392 type:complete len:202 (+) Transcript_26941:603-1208(+)